MRPPALVLALLGVAFAGCAEAERGGASGGVPGATIAMEDVDAALQECVRGDPAVGVATLDSLLGRVPTSVDALTTRGLCRWTLYAADSAEADAEGAYDDFTSALDAANEGRDDAYITPLDRIYSHRAFVARARGDGWDATIADLSLAIEAAPDNPMHRLDRGVAYRFAGDTTAARADLQRYLVLADSTDTARLDMVEEMLTELDGPEAGGP